LLGLPGLGMAQNSGIIPQMWAFLNIAGQTLDGYLVCFRALLTSKNLAFFFYCRPRLAMIGDLFCAQAIFCCWRYGWRCKTQKDMT
jgi:hypothetical protein